MKRLRRSRGGPLLFAVLTSLFFCAAIALAQTPGHKPRGASPRGKAPKSSEAAFDASAPLTQRGESAPAAPPSDKGARRKEDAGVVEVRGGGDGGTRVFRFGEVDIEGRLRSPQIVYFLRRVRAEFAAGDLGHRSFMLELSETRKDPNF